jgi:hypothetical protein
MCATCWKTPERMAAVDHTWLNVPDPRDPVCPGGGCCSVVLHEHRWSHIREHVDHPEEPWADWLADQLAERLRDSYHSSMNEQERQAVRQEVSQRMETAARECLGVPLAALYDVAQEPKETGTGSRSPWALTADLVLRCGAKLCIRERERGRYEVCSCFFHRCVCGRPAERRWRWLVRFLIQRYAKDNGNGTYSPPDSSWGAQHIPETGETVATPRFRNDRRWGLDRPVGEPWFGISDPWPPPPPPPPPVSGLGRRPSSH